jgi:hypothetical protein
MGMPMLTPDGTALVQDTEEWLRELRQPRRQAVRRTIRRRPKNCVPRSLKRRRSSRWHTSPQRGSADGDLRLASASGGRSVGLWSYSISHRTPQVERHITAKAKR